MRIRYFLVIALLCLTLPCAAQSGESIPYQVYAGYSYLSNSFNGVPGSRQPLNGWDAALGFAPWHHLRFKLDYSMYRGTNLGAPQNPFLILGGGQYEVSVGRESFFAQALVGEAGLNRNWYSANGVGYKNGSTGTNASFAEVLGGGIDTRISRHTAIRVEGGMQHTGFDPIALLKDGGRPYHLAGVPNYFGRFSAGIVWMPHVEPAGPREPHTPVASELVFEGLNSVGHFKIFANSWWSYLSVAGVEYDRHSWGTMIGARRDYSAEFLPLVLVRQPSVTDIWGNPKSTSHTLNPGVGVYPIGMRLLWRDGDRIKPYFIARGGIVGYAQKAFSQDAAYENFSLDYRIGLQFRASDRVDFRAGFGILHQSDGFVVPSNPGLDEMNVNAGISYHLGGGPGAR
ncbi:MAG TPA: acyloxyacyl hydrolase [Terracidiphilus sp.]|nr:acyloxyacyl hydrolase [Terracidiphilus sp.]